MKNSISFISIICLIQFNTAIFAQSPTLIWAEKLEGVEARDLKIDPDKNIYATGFFGLTANFGDVTLTSINNSYDIYISKQDSDGSVIWAKRMGGTEEDWAFSLAQDTHENIYSTGYIRGNADFGDVNLTSYGMHDIYVNKMDAEGNFIWAKRFGGSDNHDSGSSIDSDNENNVYVAGYFYSEIANFGITSFSNFSIVEGWADGFFMKLDSDGNVLWANQIGGIGDDGIHHIYVDFEGNIFITGSFQDTVDFDPGEGVFNLTNTGVTPDIFISKYNSDGNFIWAKQMKGTGWGFGRKIITDNQGNVYLTGSFTGITDFDPGVGVLNLTSVTMDYWDVFITKLDSEGNLIWVKQMGGDINDWAGDIALSTDNDIYLTGSFWETAGFGDTYLTSKGIVDIYISKLDNDGNFLWSRGVGGIGGDIGMSIETDSENNLYVSGMFEDTVDFGLGNETHNLSVSHGINNAFILKIKEEFLNTEDIDFTKLFTYPNPTTGIINFSEPVSDVKVFDLSGKLVKSFNGLVNKVDISGLQNAVYILKGRNAKGVNFSKRIIKN